MSERKQNVGTSAIATSRTEAYNLVLAWVTALTLFIVRWLRKA